VSIERSSELAPLIVQEMPRPNGVKLRGGRCVRRRAAASGPCGLDRSCNRHAARRDPCAAVGRPRTRSVGRIRATLPCTRDVKGSFTSCRRRSAHGELWCCRSTLQRHSKTNATGGLDRDRVRGRVGRDLVVQDDSRDQSPPGLSVWWRRLPWIQAVGEVRGHTHIAPNASIWPVDRQEAG
jgi:hypothetical protein